MWLKQSWKLATQICHRCTLKDQVHLITKTSATKLAHPLVSRHARLAANILWQPMTPRSKPQESLHSCMSERECQWGGTSPRRSPEPPFIRAFPGTLRRSCARANVKIIPDPLPAICEQGLQPPNVNALKVLQLKSIASCLQCLWLRMLCSSCK